MTVAVVIVLAVVLYFVCYGGSGGTIEKSKQH